jgi:serine/threonine-protein kinase RsbW
MTDDGWAWSAERVFPSDRAAGRAIIDEIVARLHGDRWHAHDVFSIRLALEEAIINAIRHGNASVVSKQVKLVARLSTDRFVVEIVDEGPGFRMADVPDCTAVENLDKPSGRGVMLMRSYMTRVEYNDKGNAVFMEKVRQSR